MLRKIEAFLVPSKLEPLRDFLLKNGVEGLSVTPAKGVGTRSPKNKEGKPEFEERVKVEIVLSEDRVDDLVLGLRSLASREAIGGGMVFVTPVEDAIRVGTREAGKSAIL